MTFLPGNPPWNKGLPEQPNEFSYAENHVIMFIRRENHPDLEVLLDREVHERIRHLRWFSVGKQGYNDYAWRRNEGKLHRFILGLQKGDHRRVDHINRNRHDNRLCNLRLVNQSENMRNHGLFASNKTGVNGVFFNKQKQQYQAYIKTDYKQLHLGFFKTLGEAAAARKQAEIKFWIKKY